MRRTEGPLQLDVQALGGRAGSRQVGMSALKKTQGNGIKGVPVKASLRQRHFSCRPSDRLGEEGVG